MARPLPVPVVTDSSAGDALYVSAPKVYPREIAGRFARLRNVAVFVLLGMFYLFPWLAWDGRQAVLFDLPARKFYVFGLHFWPQDFIYLAWLLVMAALTLFLFTAIAGRLWCGYACPQTVWTEVFLWMERITEGTRNQRMKLDAAPWSANKLAKKGAKQFLWITFALWTGFTFVGFFTPIRALGADVLALEVGGWSAFWAVFYAVATYGNAGYLREQVCKYMCPYARFQGAMFDRDTLIIEYDAKRGDPRGSRRKSVLSVLERSIADAESNVALLGQPKPADLGDCTDCTICVQVCPTGIDIRNGLQYECIACGSCIDACDQVMDKLGYPRGLVRYTTQHASEGAKTRFMRPRVLVYGALLSLAFGSFAWSVTHRTDLLVDVLRDRNALFRTAADGAIENAYTLKIVNKTAEARQYRVALENEAGLVLANVPELTEVMPESVLAVPVTVRSERDAVRGKAEVTFVVESVDGAAKATVDSRFFGPIE